MNPYQKGLVVGRTLAAIDSNLDKVELVFHADCLFGISGEDTNDMDIRSGFFIGVGVGFAAEKSKVSIQL